MSNYLGFLDIVAVTFCIASWVAYTYYATFQSDTYNLVKAMHRYRLQWIKHAIKREDRSIDVRIITSLMQTTTILSLIAIIAVVSIVALMGYSPRAIILLKQLPFVSTVTVNAWFMKSAVLMIFFIFSFFKLTWVIRQLAYACVLIVAAPAYKEGGESIEELKRQTKYVTKTATIISNASRHFNTAIRSYYFGLAALSWYISPVLFILATLCVLSVLYRREFMSKTLILLS